MSLGWMKAVVLLLPILAAGCSAPEHAWANSPTFPPCNPSAPDHYTVTTEDWSAAVASAKNQGWSNVTVGASNGDGWSGQIWPVSGDCKTGAPA